jgi:trk system potassium uptake protein TrkA
LKIVILGAGRVGASVAESLVSEQNDITVIDTDGARLAELQDRLDLRTVVGNAAQPSTLRAAGADDADMVIATTQSDETNLVACHLAAQVFNVPTRIARVRGADFQDNPELVGEGAFSVDHLIVPEKTVTDYVAKLVEFPEALQVLEFAGGAASLIAVRAHPGGLLVGKPIRDIKSHIPQIDSRIVAIFRGDGAVYPDGDTLIEPGDEVFVLAATEHIRTVMTELRKMDKPVRRVMLAGGSPTTSTCASSSPTSGAASSSPPSCPRTCWCSTATPPTRTSSRRRASAIWTCSARSPPTTRTTSCPRCWPRRWVRGA